ncbi:hypothetical protein TNCV_1517841 [Trichonephila clavipes]|nr:hypothetical protein TNCV_1517841 [Trichonephila clavipes]
MAAVAIQAGSRWVLLERGLVTSQAMEVRHILKDITGRVTNGHDRRLLLPASAHRLQMVSIHTPGFLEGGKLNRIDSSGIVGEDVATYMTAQSSRVFLFVGSAVDYPFSDLLLPTPSNYHIAPTEEGAETPVRPTCFFVAYYTPPLKFQQMFVLL